MEDLGLNMILHDLVVGDVAKTLVPKNGYTIGPDGPERHTVSPSNYFVLAALYQKTGSIIAAVREVNVRNGLKSKVSMEKRRGYIESAGPPIFIDARSIVEPAFWISEFGPVKVGTLYPEHTFRLRKDKTLYEISAGFGYRRNKVGGVKFHEGDDFTVVGYSGQSVDARPFGENGDNNVYRIPGHVTVDYSVLKNERR